MFCSTLRKRPAFASVVQALGRDEMMMWKEAELHTHDVSFLLPGRKQSFYILLVHIAEAESHALRERIQRLKLLGGGSEAAIFLLLEGEKAMEGFMRLQMDRLNGDCIQFIPIFSTHELPARLNTLRKDKTQAQYNVHNAICERSQDFVSNCVQGPALMQHQTRMLTGFSSGLPDLAMRLTTSEGCVQIKRYLGDEDGHRIISFFTNGPRSNEF